MKTKPIWFTALSPLIGVAIGLVAAVMMRESWINSGKRPCAKIWDVC
jgi:hypothetical protein